MQFDPGFAFSEIIRNRIRVHGKYFVDDDPLRSYLYVGRAWCGGIEVDPAVGSIIRAPIRHIGHGSAKANVIGDGDRIRFVEINAITGSAQPECRMQDALLGLPVGPDDTETVRRHFGGIGSVRETVPGRMRGIVAGKPTREIKGVGGWVVEFEPVVELPVIVGNRSGVGSHYLVDQ